MEYTNKTYRLAGQKGVVKMTKKHYTRIAKALKDAKDYDYKHLRISQDIAYILKEDNPNFNDGKKAVEFCLNAYSLK